MEVSGLILSDQSQANKCRKGVELAAKISTFLDKAEKRTITNIDLSRDKLDQTTRVGRITHQIQDGGNL